MMSLENNASDFLRLLYKEPTEEILTEERLKKYMQSNEKLRHYIGYEISGYVHLGTGILSMSKLLDLQRAGVDTTVFLADYHSWINNKLGGDLDTIKKVAGGYFKEALKKSLEVVGGNPDNVKYVLGSEIYKDTSYDYFENLLKISMNTSLSRIRRSITILGRKKGEKLDFAQYLYPPMQVADIFNLKVNLAHGGMDQRKAHVIAIDVGQKIGLYKPVALHHHLLIGMNVTEDSRNKILMAKKLNNREQFEDGIIDIKMSKSKPKSAIFIHDTEDDIKRKVNQAYCPQKESELNPVLDLARYVIFRGDESELPIINKKTDMEKIYNTYPELEKAYVDGAIHPMDLKSSVSERLIDILEPARKYFLYGNGKKYLEEMKSIEISR